MLEFRLLTPVLTLGGLRAGSAPAPTPTAASSLPTSLSHPYGVEASTAFAAKSTQEKGLAGHHLRYRALGKKEKRKAGFELWIVEIHSWRRASHFIPP